MRRPRTLQAVDEPAKMVELRLRILALTRRELQRSASGEERIVLRRCSGDRRVLRGRGFLYRAILRATVKPHGPLFTRGRPVARPSARSRISASDGSLTDDATVTISVTGSTGGGGGGCCLPFALPTPEIFEFESFNGVPATPGTIGRTTLGGAQVEILGPWWLD